MANTTCLDCKVLPPWSIILCPMHEAASAMLAALRDALDLLVCDAIADNEVACSEDELCDVCKVKATARDAIRRATAAA